MQVREYPFLDSDVFEIFDDLLEANIIDLPEMKRPEEVERKDDPRYCKYHRLVGHTIQNCFVFKDKVMQLARQGKISLEEDFATTNAVIIESRHVDGNKDSCNAMHGDNITRDEDTLFRKDDSSDADDCMSTIIFTDEDLLLGSKPHNRPLFVAGYVHEQKVNRILIDEGSAVNILPLRILKELGFPIDELSNSRFMIEGFNQGRQRAVGIIRMQLTMEDMVSSALFHVINAKTFTTCFSVVPDAKKGNEVLPSEELKSCNNENTRKNDSSTLKVELLKDLTLPLTQINLNRIQPQKEAQLGKLPPEAIGKKLHGLNATHMMLKEKGHAIQDSRVDHKTEENLRESVFNKLGPHRKALHGIANRQSIFDRVLKAKAQTMIFTRVQSDDEDDKESVASSNYICNGAENDIAQTYHITLIEDSEEEEETYIALLHEFKDVFAWSYNEMPGLYPKVAVHHLSVKKGACLVKQGQRRFRPELIPLIEGEVNKLIEVGFIQEVKYPMWIFSIVPIRKKNGQIRVYVDFRNLNNACPKDDFPLPIAELMIDATTGH
ncbi:hypothetical protein Sango_0664100 [Sesamum angolense]|uniref:Retrotransposon gag protein n=1 Tax=Sesamum angolense TaxID=2727404 RepID=A0AAE1X7M0_9LAMI|nr:hypothetical protein Sango_0664100 [Sesamum angolense]